MGGGFKKVADSMRPMAEVMPAGVDWLQTSVTGFDPDTNTVTTSDGKTVQYDYLVVVSDVHAVRCLAYALKMLHKCSICS